jgi:hypothetical protein
MATPFSVPRPGIRHHDFSTTPPALASRSGRPTSVHPTLLCRLFCLMLNQRNLVPGESQVAITVAVLQNRLPKPDT